MTIKQELQKVQREINKITKQIDKLATTIGKLEAKKATPPKSAKSAKKKSAIKRRALPIGTAYRPSKAKPGAPVHFITDFCGATIDF